MIARWFALAVWLLATPVWAGNESRAAIVYLGLADDPYYAPQPVYTGLSLRDRNRPIDGARVAMLGTRVLGRALGLSFALNEVLLTPGASPIEAVRDARVAGALAVLLDLPDAEMAALLQAEGAADGVLINVRHRAGRWRAEDCAPDLVHTLPSHAMLSDALAQHLRARNWSRVLLLSGSGEPDIEQAEAARRSIAKFGLTLAADRVFELSNDPRQRELNNIALLTGDARYDVIWLIDDEGEFGRYVPYATYLARPVVGSEGLTPRAWHWTYERHGAPQLNQRFRRAAGRDMASEDWAAWVAVRAVVEAVSRVGAADADAVGAYLRSTQMSLDLYKGAPGSFRMWDGQLRQPILIATHNAVIERAPLDGFEHQTDTLDTLGSDRTESGCAR